MRALARSLWRRGCFVGSFRQPCASPSLLAGRSVGAPGPDMALSGMSSRASRAAETGSGRSSSEWTAAGQAGVVIARGQGAGLRVSERSRASRGAEAAKDPSRTWAQSGQRPAPSGCAVVAAHCIKCPGTQRLTRPLPAPPPYPCTASRQGASAHPLNPPQLCSMLVMGRASSRRRTGLCQRLCLACACWRSAPVLCCNCTVAGER